MYPDMYYDSVFSGGGAAALFTAILTGGLVVCLVISLVCYIFGALGNYTIAKRRGIHHPWLAWIPVMNAWVVGCISDQYQYLNAGRNTHRRVILLVLETVTAVLSVVMLFTALIPMLRIAVGMLYTGTAADALVARLMAYLAAASIWSVLLSGVSIVNMVFHYMAMYDLYRSAVPGNGVLFLVLSIVLGVLGIPAEPFFVFGCRNRDDGMPPRREV